MDGEEGRQRYLLGHKGLSNCALQGCCYLIRASEVGYVSEDVAQPPVQAHGLPRCLPLRKAVYLLERSAAEQFPGCISRPLIATPFSPCCLKILRWEMTALATFKIVEMSV